MSDSEDDKPLMKGMLDSKLFSLTPILTLVNT